MFARRWMKYPLIVVGAAATGISLWSYYHIHQMIGGLHKSLSRNGEKPEIELRGVTAAVFPWQDSAEDWELQKVKLTGHFLLDRYFVRKEYKGKPGFLIFKPFVTAYAANIDFLIPEEEMRAGRPRGILVNIGWIPADQLRNFEEPALGKPCIVRPDENFKAGEKITDGATSLIYQVVEEDGELDEEVPSPVTIQGYLRRPEEKLWIAGKWQDDRTKQRNYVELRHMLRNAFFDNINDAEEYYLDLHYEKEEEEEAGLLIGASNQQEIVSIVEDMEKNSHVYRMKTYIMSSSLLLLASSILL